MYVGVYVLYVIVNFSVCVQTLMSVFRRRANISATTPRAVLNVLAELVMSCRWTEPLVKVQCIKHILLSRTMTHSK